MGLRRYHFTSTWSLPVPAPAVFTALEALGDYPHWWPEVQVAEPLDGGAHQLTCRALLPYDLVFTTTPTRQDPGAGILEAELRGDLEGMSRWTITTYGPGATALFEEDVVATKRSLRYLAPVARPLFRLNHRLMMRHGRAGLRTYLAGYELARRVDPG